MNNEVFAFGDSMVRAVEENGRGYFVAKDVAVILGFERAHEMTRYLDDDEQTEAVIETSGGAQKMTVLTEGGVYHAIFNSRSERAREFRRWVTDDVLPKVRSTGIYTDDNVKQKEIELRLLEIEAKETALISFMDRVKKGTAAKQMLNTVLNYNFTAKRLTDRAPRLPVYERDMYIKESLSKYVAESLIKSAQESYIILKEVYAEWLGVAPKEIQDTSQTLFTKHLCRLFPDINIRQLRIKGFDSPVQVIEGYKFA